MEQMKQEGVQPDIHTYTSFVNACCKAGDMQVSTLHRNLKEDGSRRIMDSFILACFVFGMSLLRSHSSLDVLLNIFSGQSPAQGQQAG